MEKTTKKGLLVAAAAATALLTAGCHHVYAVDKFGNQVDTGYTFLGHFHPNTCNGMSSCRGVAASCQGVVKTTPKGKRIVRQ